MTGSRREAVLICYLIAGAAGLLAVFLTQATLVEAIFVACVTLAVSLFGIWWLEFRHGGVREPDPIPEQARSLS
jgi:UDP-GlcNAc:undecaprenyl-phosphate GlcNAc-1-phosphate transferase